MLHRSRLLAFGDGRRRTFKRAAIAGSLALLMMIAWWPTSRRVGVNYAVSSERLPLWQKAAEFMARDAHLRRTSREVLGEIGGTEAKALAALSWTRANIRYAPRDLPVIDDHISKVIARRYGQADQQADVFTALLAYAGVRAYWEPIGESPRVIPLSYVSIDGHWRVFDVTRGLVFRNAVGELATADEIAGDRHIVARAARESGLDPIDGYLSYFSGYRRRPAPDVMRAELQMPARRLRFEMRRVFGTATTTSHHWQD